MIAVRDSGKAVKVKGFYNHKDEYDYLVQCIVDLVKSGVPYEDSIRSSKNHFEWYPGEVTL